MTYQLLTERWKKKLHWGLTHSRQLKGRIILSWIVCLSCVLAKKQTHSVNLGSTRKPQYTTEDPSETAANFWEFRHYTGWNQKDLPYMSKPTSSINCAPASPFRVPSSALNYCCKGLVDSWSLSCLLKVQTTFCCEWIFCSSRIWFHLVPFNWLCCVILNDRLTGSGWKYFSLLQWNNVILFETATWYSNILFQHYFVILCSKISFGPFVC